MTKMRFIWRQKEKKASRPLSEQEIQKHLYGSYLKPAENEKTAYTKLIKEELEKEKKELEKNKQELTVEKERETNKRKLTEQHLAAVRAELEQARKKLSSITKKNLSLKRTLLENRQSPIREIQIPKIAFRALPKQLILVPTVILAILLVIFTFGKISSWREHKGLTTTTAMETEKSIVLTTLYTIQICVYEKESEARDLVNKLKTNGYPAHFVSKVSEKGTGYFNIYVGKFPTKNKAADFLNKIKDKEDFKEFKDSFVRKI